jgi:DNA-binding response OmpR family regulator
MDVAETFEEAGFKVFHVGTAHEAISVLEREPMIRVVFVEAELPGTMDGIELAHHVRERWPPTVLMVTSSRIPRKKLPQNSHFVQKPYLEGGLAKAVQGTMSQIASQ